MLSVVTHGAEHQTFLVGLHLMWALTMPLLSLHWCHVHMTSTSSVAMVS